MLVRGNRWEDGNAILPFEWTPYILARFPDLQAGLPHNTLMGLTKAERAGATHTRSATKLAVKLFQIRMVMYQESTSAQRRFR